MIKMIDFKSPSERLRIAQERIKVLTDGLYQLEEDIALSDEFDPNVFTSEDIISKVNERLNQLK